MKAQRGGFVLGLIVGLLLGLALALGVALYITKVPVPFIDKVPQRTAEQDSIEAERNKNWNPNAPLAEKVMPVPAASAPAADASGAAAPTSASASAPATATVAPTPSVAPPVATPARPAPNPAAILSGAPAAQPFVYYVQVGAFTRAEEAEQQRARMAMIGYSTKVTRQSQSGRDVYRVRMGPYETRDEAESTQARLQDVNIDARLVRVDRQ
jgi:cell division protein FtsN